jgi:hypothetical protein
MKREAARYVFECNTCWKVKADYMKPGGMLQPLSVPEWKWDDISMDFIGGLPLMACKFDSIWVIVDRLSKSAHFIPFTPLTIFRSMWRSISLTCYACTEF